MERFSENAIAKNNKSKEVAKPKAKKNQKYISKMVNGEKHMVMNPNYVYPHGNNQYKLHILQNPFFLVGKWIFYACLYEYITTPTKTY